MSRCNVEGLEHRFFAGGLFLHFGQHISGTAVDGLQTDDVLITKLAMEPVNMAVLPVAFADLARHLRRQRAHLRGRPISFNVSVILQFRNQGQKRCLLQLHREALLQRVVENFVAGLVVEVGDDDGVFVGELGWTMRDEVPRSYACNCRTQTAATSSQGFRFLADEAC